MRRSSAGNTRGLIEAKASALSFASVACLPRGIPAASLKRELVAGNPVYLRYDSSSAGNTRGLIEAGDVWTTHLR